jgi:hypothetical protein
MPARHHLSVGGVAVLALGQGRRMSGGCIRGRQQRPEPRSQVYNADSASISAGAACWVRAAPGPGLPSSSVYTGSGGRALKNRSVPAEPKGWAVLGVDGVVTKSVNLDHERVWEPNLDASIYGRLVV